METPLLEVEAVAKRFTDSASHQVQALEGISLLVQDGEFVSVLGASGCGKSTLLRLVAGLEMPTEGEIRFCGDLVTAPGPERGLVFQAYNAFPWLTVKENIEFGLRSLGGKIDGEKVAHFLKITGLEGFAEAYPKVLSGGMRQRLAIARTLAVEPRLLLLDEPFGALDELTRDSMQQMLLHVLSESRCAVLMVTHDIREAILLSDRIIVLSPRPGRIVRVRVSSLPKPRTRQQMRSAEFDRLHEDMRNELVLAAKTGIISADIATS